MPNVERCSSTMDVLLHSVVTIPLVFSKNIFFIAFQKRSTSLIDLIVFANKWLWFFNIHITRNFVHFMFFIDFISTVAYLSIIVSITSMCRGCSLNAHSSSLYSQLEHLVYIEGGDPVWISYVAKRSMAISSFSMLAYWKNIWYLYLRCWLDCNSSHSSLMWFANSLESFLCGKLNYVLFSKILCFLCSEHFKKNAFIL